MGKREPPSTVRHGGRCTKQTMWSARLESVRKRSKHEGGVLSRKAARREDQVQAYAEQENGILKCNGRMHSCACLKL